MKTRPASGAVTDSGHSQTVTSGKQAQRRQIRSVNLFRGQREVPIEHAGELYSLRLTSKGKLILTK